MSNITIAGNAAGTATFTVASPATNTNRTLTLPDATTTLVGTDEVQTLTNKTIHGGALTQAAAQASTSGTSIDFTGIPSWAKRVTVILSGVSTNGTSLMLVQLGDSGGIETTGYVSGSSNTSSTAGFLLNGSGNAAHTYSGVAPIVTVGTNSWVTSGVISESNAFGSVFGGNKILSDTLDRIRITTVNGTDTFDAGTINIMWEG
jgi:hypothetical protein